MCYLHTIMIPNSCTCEECMYVHACGGQMLTSGAVPHNLSLGLGCLALEPQERHLPISIDPQLPSPGLFTWRDYLVVNICLTSRRSSCLRGKHVTEPPLEPPVVHFCYVYLYDIDVSSMFPRGRRNSCFYRKDCRCRHMLGTSRLIIFIRSEYQQKF